MTNLDRFKEAADEQILASRLERNIKLALTGNLPKHKIRKYQPIVTNAYVRRFNANEKLQAAYKKLSEIEKAMVSTA